MKVPPGLLDVLPEEHSEKLRKAFNPWASASEMGEYNLLVRRVVEEALGPHWLRFLGPAPPPPPTQAATDKKRPRGKSTSAKAKGWKSGRRDDERKAAKYGAKGT